MSYRKAIHDLLVTTANGATFTEIKYSNDHPSLVVEGTAVPVRSVEANEIRSAFAVDSQKGRSFSQERTAWAWLLRLRFGSEVLLEEFEDSLLSNPLFITRDPSSGIDKPVRLLLEDSSYEHPPRGGASNGTEATYRFLAELCY